MEKLPLEDPDVYCPYSASDVVTVMPARLLATGQRGDLPWGGGGGLCFVWRQLCL